MHLLIQHGEIVTATATEMADVLCCDGKIIAIGPNLTAPADAQIIDARGHLIFPGFIDPHVHIYLPFMGTFAADD